MEQLKNHLPEKREILQQQLVTIGNYNTPSSISIYKGELTKQCFLHNIELLQLNKFDIDAQFSRLLLDRVRENHFSDSRLNASISHLIDTFTYKTIRIADIIQFDRRIPLFSYEKYSEIILNTASTSFDFEKTNINGVLFWVKKSDLALHNLSIDYFKK